MPESTLQRSARLATGWLRGPHGLRNGLIAIAGLGVILRLHEYAILRAFRRDEAMLLLNIQSRTWLGLTEQLADNQGAPVLFLWVEKLVMTLLGGGEAAMRLWPVLAGTAALLVLGGWVYRRFDGVTALTALGVFAIARHPIFYATDAKQYSTDSLITVLLFLAVERLRDVSARQPLFWLLLAGGAASVWLSHPAVFVIAGLGTAWLLAALFGRDRARFLRVAAFCAVAAASFVVQYVLILRHLAANQFLLDWWTFAFMPFPPTSWQDLDWFRWTLMTSLRSYTTSVSINLAALLAVAGAVQLYRNGRTRFWTILLPFAFTLAASAAHQYPFHTRLIQFLFPLFALLIGAGMSAAVELGRRWARPAAVAAVLSILLFAPPLLHAGRLLFTSHRAAEIRPLLKTLRERWEPGDCLFTHWKTNRQFRYYAPRYGLGGTDLCVVEYETWSGDGLRQYRELGEPARLWFVFSEIAPKEWGPEADALPGAPYREVERIETGDTALILFRVKEP